MQLILFDDAQWTALFPFTHTRPSADIRCGIFTARERWQQLLSLQQSFSLTEAYLQDVFPNATGPGPFLYINGRVIGNEKLATELATLQVGASLQHDGQIVAAKLEHSIPNMDAWHKQLASLNPIECLEEPRWLHRPWDIFSNNDWAIRQDFFWLKAGRESAPLPADVCTRGTEIFVETGARIDAGSIFNAESGPIYIGSGAEVMEGCKLRGPISVCAGATLKMDAKIYGATTIGPGCKVGGEVGNVVFFANSNKGHDGFLGNAVIGEWCNLGADTNCSNLKNNYDEVKAWDEAANKSVRTGLSFCGLLMGDHSKSGINTMFNTGTIAGVSCNIWGSGFPEKFIPSFTWGGPQGMSTYQFERALETAERMMARRHKTLSEAERALLLEVFHRTAAGRQLIFGS
ncbi:MAG: GlmU family protein [Bacteroidetes bacterium]|nr:GlmU family protein [Bacteroidota bacterium]